MRLAQQSSQVEKLASGRFDDTLPNLRYAVEGLAIYSGLYFLSEAGKVLIVHQRR
jgi:hypothetical protein